MSWKLSKDFLHVTSLRKSCLIAPFDKLISLKDQVIPMLEEQFWMSESSLCQVKLELHCQIYTLSIYIPNIVTYKGPDTCNLCK